ncbi:MAG: hypothetical protein ACK6AD_01755 [Cyanobacteriota bacterium]|jgi:hypothetical protein
MPRCVCRRLRGSARGDTPAGARVPESAARRVCQGSELLRSDESQDLGRQALLNGSDVASGDSVIKVLSCGFC